ncbi:MAG: diiron oxygenase [Sphingomonadaceae bacterium]
MPAAATPRYEDPLFQIDWNAVDRDCWWLPPDALSLSGVAEFEALPIATRRRLSHCEYLHLLQTGLWLEALFVERLAVLADRAPDLDRRAAYLREIRDEAGHSLMFVELIRRSGIAMPAARGMRVRLGRALGGRLIPAGSALFWALVVVGEEVPNRLNRRLARGVENATLSTVVYRMATLHSRDEASHAALARAHCEQASACLPAWRRTALAPLLAATIALLVRQLHYPPPWIYESAGLRPAARWHEAARRNPIRSALARETLAPTRAFLQRAGWRI